jgi:hypothetical protein
MFREPRLVQIAIPRQSSAWMVLCSCVLAAALLAGCGSDTRISWPPPALTLERGGDLYQGYDVDDDGRLDYLQRTHDGYKDRLYFPSEPGGALDRIVRRPARDLPHERVLLLMLDGVAYERMEAAYAAGRFRLFTPPARLVSIFPTLTDPAYDRFFGTGPTPGYEASYFDRATNRLTDPYHVYLCGANESWAHYSDYRLNLLVDAFMYLYPRQVYHYELRKSREVLDRVLAIDRRQATLYLLSTDALGHMLTTGEIDAELARLDEWIERAEYDCGGRLEIVMLADHGMSTAASRSFDVEAVLKAAGLRPRDRLEAPGDVAVPRFGLLDVARVHTYDAATRERVVAALTGRPEVEAVAWRDGASLHIRNADGTARVTARSGSGDTLRYRYEPAPEDALHLAPALTQLAAARQLDADGFAPADAWFKLTADDAFPDLPVRLWDGMLRNSREQPDVVVSLSPDYFFGSGFLAGFVHMHGTHGGFHRRATDTFATTTGLALFGPLTHDQLGEVLRNHYGLQTGALGPRAGETPTPPTTAPGGVGIPPGGVGVPPATSTTQARTH